MFKNMVMRTWEILAKIMAMSRAIVRSRLIEVLQMMLRTVLAWLRKVLV